MKKTNIQGISIIFFILGLLLFLSTFLLLKSQIGFGSSHILKNAKVGTQSIPVDEQLTKVNYSKKEFLKLLNNYIDTKDIKRSGFSFEGRNLIAQVDMHLSSSQLSGPLLDLYNKNKSEREKLLDEYLKSANVASMGYATISDYLKGTQLCNEFEYNDKLYCKDQYITLEYIVENKKVDFGNISLGTPLLHSLYSTQNAITKDTHIKNTKIILEEYVDSGDSSKYLD